MELYADRIEVDMDDQPHALPAPRAFVWRGHCYQVVKVLRTWHDAGFANRGRQQRWWERRHRTYFRVQTYNGHTCDIYLDRGILPAAGTLVRMSNSLIIPITAPTE